MEKAFKEIGLSTKGKNRPFLMAGIFLIGSVFLAIAFKTLPLMPLIMGFILLILGSFNSNIKLFKFYEKHFAFQPGVVGKKMILYDKLEEFEVENKKIIIKYKDGEKVKTIKLPKEMLEKEDIIVLEEQLNEVMRNKEV